ncbi:MAG: CBS domain-containing protein [Peptococcaceae bacterium]|nr:CBS domain-containing protein [Peptococcaceae bacterium]
MKVITTHINTDFDGLASMVAAQKLYPDAELVLPGKLARNVEEFLALHKDALEVRKPSDIPLDAVKTLIVVDTKNPGRLAKLGQLIQRPDIEIIIFDHHSPAQGDVKGSFELIEPVGAATTLLLEQIRQRQIPISPFEATILALGIYEDTGCLVFNNTTSRDAAAVAYLLSQGANLAIVDQFLGRPLTDEQNQLFKNLLLQAERQIINGIKIVIAKASSEEFIGGLALLTHKLAEIEQADAVFCLVTMDDRVHLVGRSSVPEVNVKEVMMHFGGGGHPGAASATVKTTALEELKQTMADVIRECVRPPLTARDIMTSPVKSVTVNTKVEEANQIMLRYGHSGLPVVGPEGIIGIISRRDVEKAIRHNLGHAPVKAYMTRNVVTISKDTPVTEIQALMIEKNIGRLPVVDNNQLIGIVSRTDVLKTLHNEYKPRFYTMYTPSRNRMNYRNLAEVLKRNLPDDIIQILKNIGYLCLELGCQAYLVGPMVRDAMLSIPTVDLRIIVEGDGVVFAEHLAVELDGQAKTTGTNGSTVVITPQGLTIRVITAARDYREFGVSLPQTNDAVLRQALYRQDFTINSMAIALSAHRFGDVIDYFGGRDDLRYGLIRVLHNHSFAENPLRIFRALVLEQCHDFRIERQTLKLIREAVVDRLLDRVPKTQMLQELKLLLSEKKAPKVLQRMTQLNIWPFIFPLVTYWEVQPIIHNIPRILDTIREWGVLGPAEKWLSYLIAIFHCSDKSAVDEFCTRFQLTRHQRDKILTSLDGWRQVVADLSISGPLNINHVARHIVTLPKEAYPLILALLEKQSWQANFRAALQTIENYKPSITGKDIRKLGYSPASDFKKVMTAVQQARIDNQVATKQEELHLADKLLSKWRGEPRKSV